MISLYKHQHIIIRRTTRSAKPARADRMRHIHMQRTWGVGAPDRRDRSCQCARDCAYILQHGEKTVKTTREFDRLRSTDSCRSIQKAAHTTAAAGGPSRRGMRARRHKATPGGAGAWPHARAPVARVTPGAPPPARWSRSHSVETPQGNHLSGEKL